MTRKYEPVANATPYLVQARSETCRHSFAAISATEALIKAGDLANSGERTVFILSAADGFISIDAPYEDAMRERSSKALQAPA